MSEIESMFREARTALQTAFAPAEIPPPPPRRSKLTKAPVLAGLLVAAVFAATIVYGVAVRDAPTATVTTDSLGSPATSAGGSNDAEQPAELTESSILGVRTSPPTNDLVVLFLGRASFSNSDPCTSSYRALVSESDSEVRIGIVESRPSVADNGHACRSVGFRRTLDVRLSLPLGSRQLFVLDSPRSAFDGSLLARPGGALGLPEADLGPRYVDNSWTTGFGIDGVSCEEDFAGYELTQGPSGLINAAAKAFSAATTEYHLANGIVADLFSDASGQPFLAWTANDIEHVLTSAPRCPNDRVATVAELQAFAASLTPP